MPTGITTTIRNWVHDAVAILGFATFAFGVVLAGVHSVEPAAVQAQLAPLLAIIGGSLVILSKAIDSIYAWMVARATGGAIVPGITPPAVIAASPAAAAPAPIDLSAPVG